MKKRRNFKKALSQCEKVITDMGIEIFYTKKIIPFFKGDLDGKMVFISNKLSNEEKLFNLLHLSGHTIQWNTNQDLYEIGSKLHKNPSKSLLRKLQRYEWNASRIGLSLLHKAGIKKLDNWMSILVKLDMTYLTYFYVTGKKSKRIIASGELYKFRKNKLKPKKIPDFSARKISKGTRNGIVIKF